MNARVVGWQTLASVAVLATLIVAAMIFASVPAASGGTKYSGFGKIVVERDLTLKITRLSEDSARYSGKVKVAGIAKQKHPRGVSKEGKKLARRVAKKKRCKPSRAEDVFVFHVIPGENFLIGSDFPPDKEGNYSLTGPAAPSGDKIMARITPTLTAGIEIKDIGGTLIHYKVICRKAVQFKAMP